MSRAWQKFGLLCFYLLLGLSRLAPAADSNPLSTEALFVCGMDHVGMNSH